MLYYDTMMTTKKIVRCFFVHSMKKHTIKERKMSEKAITLREYCPMGLVQKIISGKWKLFIIFILKNETLRFNELQRRIPEIRRAYLTQQLRELEKDKIIHREVYKIVPPKVEYSLTEIGIKFLDVIDKMEEWGEEYITENNIDLQKCDVLKA